MARRRDAILPGLILIAIGAWLLARNLGLPLPGLGDIWPALLLLFGLSLLVQFFAGGRTDDGLVFAGVAGTLLGGFFLAITLGPLAWSDLAHLWPVFVLIGAITFFAQWLARPAERALLIPAGLALIVGLVALLLTMGGLDPAITSQLARLWPVVLIVAGLALLASYLRRPGRGG
jgi:hypothetical protein